MQNKKFIKKKAKKPKLEELISGIKSGDIKSLSLGITLCESLNESDRQQAQLLLEACMRDRKDSLRIGITGVPGVGKSTFIEAFGLYLIEKQNKKVAVLAVDPSSERSRGSILGDKTRMNELSIHPNAFIRPSPSAGALGGVAHASRESILLCEAAGYDIILVETVGVGQSETEVRQMTDYFLLLMLAGAGDELQGIKRGIMEMADGILINKADGDNVKMAKRAKREYQNALHLFPPAKSEWKTTVSTCSALERENLEDAWKSIVDYQKLTLQNGYFEANRSRQLGRWFEKSIEEMLRKNLFSNPTKKEQFKELKNQVEKGLLSPYAAAIKLLN